MTNPMNVKSDIKDSNIPEGGIKVGAQKCTNWRKSMKRAIDGRFVA